MRVDARKFELAFRFFHGRGYALRDLQHPLRLRRKLPTLKKWARRLDLSFPDYTPPSCRKLQK